MTDKVQVKYKPKTNSLIKNIFKYKLGKCQI